MNRFFFSFFFSLQLVRESLSTFFSELYQLVVVRYFKEKGYVKQPIPLVLLLDFLILLGMALFIPSIFRGSVVLFGICILQNTAFSLVSRSRNRDNQVYHALAAVGSNGIWFATMKYMIDLEMAGWLIAPYIIGTVTGSLTGAKISMFIEKMIGATSDGHLK